MTAAREPYVDQALLLAAERIEQTGWAAELCDPTGGSCGSRASSRP